MDIHQIFFSFQRAFSHVFNRRKLLLVFLALLLCGAVSAFCRAFSVAIGPWADVGLLFMPFYICSSILAPLGILLIRAYYHGVKDRATSFSSILKQSWQVMLNSSYFFFLLLLLHLLLWMLLGIFFLIKSIPFIGEGISIILAAGPFIIILVMLLLSLLPLAVLFFLVPFLALKEKELQKGAEMMWQRWRRDPLSHLILLLIGLVPAIATVLILLIATFVTEATYLTGQSSLSVAFQWLCTMVPFAALLTPSVCFFFHFAAESFVFIGKNMKAK